MLDTAAMADGQRELPRALLTFAHEEAIGTHLQQQNLRPVPGHVAMVPRLAQQLSGSGWGGGGRGQDTRNLREQVGLLLQQTNTHTLFLILKKRLGLKHSTLYIRKAILFFYSNYKYFSIPLYTCSVDSDSADLALSPGRFLALDVRRAFGGGLG